MKRTKTALTEQCNPSVLITTSSEQSQFCDQQLKETPDQTVEEPWTEEEEGTEPDLDRFICEKHNVRYRDVYPPQPKRTPQELQEWLAEQDSKSYYDDMSGGKTVYFEAKQESSLLSRSYVEACVTEAIKHKTNYIGHFRFPQHNEEFLVGTNEHNLRRWIWEVRRDEGSHCGHERKIVVVNIIKMRSTPLHKIDQWVDSFFETAAAA